MDVVLSRGPHSGPHVNLYTVIVTVSSLCGPKQRACSAKPYCTGTFQSRGPWLACGICCSAGSSLTMASSETLDPLPSSMRSNISLAKKFGAPHCGACQFLTAIRYFTITPGFCIFQPQINEFHRRPLPTLCR